MESKNNSEKEKKSLDSKEKKELLKEKASEKIRKLKELVKSLGLDNMDDIMRFLENVESLLDGLEISELQKTAEKIQDEILISLEKDKKLKSSVKLQFAMLFNDDVKDSYNPDDQFAYL